MRIAWINSDMQIINVVVSESLEESVTPPEGLEAIEIPAEVGIGCRLVEGEWVYADPVEEDPEEPPPPTTDDLLVLLQSSIEYLQEQVDILLLESLG